MAVQNVLLKFGSALGDIVAMTAAVRDLKLAHPHLQLQVDVAHPEVFFNNPYLSNVGQTSFDRVVEFAESDYREGVERSQQGQRRHFIEWFHQVFGERLGLTIPLTEPKPDLHLQQPRRPPVPYTDYWVIFAGGKHDITLKHWSFDRYQEVALRLRDAGIKLVQTGRKQDVHPPLLAAHDLVGWGGIRELFELIYFSSGVICPITSGMHIAAALNKPAVVIGGGREEPWFEAYNNEFGCFEGLRVDNPHRFLHSLGQLPCCQQRGCWKRRLWGSGSDVCTTRASDTRQVLPACMDLVTVSQVVNAVISLHHPVSEDKPEESAV